MRAKTTMAVALAAALAGLAGCSSSGNAGGAEGRINVRLVDGPTDYQAIELHVLRVEISTDGSGWRTLGTPDVVVDLLTLTGGVEEMLVNGASLPAGHYGQMRLVLGAGNRVKVADEWFDLKVPSGMQSGVKLLVDFDVAPGTTKDVFIDFDAHRSVFVHRTGGGSAKYLMRPTVRAYDKVVTGSIAGTLTDAASHAPLAGIEVTAQRLDGAGVPTIALRSTTGTDGTYLLGLLPVGGTYYVVSQPVAGTKVYEANASAAVSIAETAPVVIGVDLGFTATEQHGTVKGGIAPAATEDQGDVVSALAPVMVGGTPRTFVLRTAPGVVEGGVETYEIDGLPAGSYELHATRGTVDGSGGVTEASGPAASAIVTAGATTTRDLAAP